MRKVSVIGLGYVGLPVAVNFAKNSRVIGFDINKSRIKELNQSKDSTNEIDFNDFPNIDIIFTDSIDILKEADFHIVAVPTPIDNSKQPDLRPIKAASTTVAKALKNGDIVVYESTVYPGVTEDICVPILEKESGLKHGQDFWVGYSPERINPGDKEHTFTKITKVVSGCCGESLKVVSEVYKSVVTAGVYEASSIKVAEAAKVIENTQRDVNIALINELALIFDRMDINTLEVLEAAGTKWNFLNFRPGLVGGHCIGVDPYYLTHKAEQLNYHPNVILSGRKINDYIPKFIAEKAIKLMIKNKVDISSEVVTILGLTFKENCPDLRNSKVVEIVSELQSFGIKVQIHDPEASKNEALQEYGLEIVKNIDELQKSNVIIGAVSHKVYNKQYLNKLITDDTIILDVKNFLKGMHTGTYWSL
ncbi:UDP-N-acetyl-D-galactosamine dehydrogenase [Halobacteriovorax sp. BALOs_7]|uniref:Nucleotide sugar dehydrogenase n=1 Tax=Halobacteriovorax vibrionivorans TaxID=2152716 RepID=A0ABY0IPG9_9BACT|nr:MULTISPECIES: nucleotide sugar dehydrogenase [Halobacteriovorax]AYF43051.1 UDP-N-acetyl-D-galactosamine dehydrogenase [Halobacteriovorax sp. BALOs_7]RZF23077.1 nucleotide sugar dehydrogenase [Halobacteriovorax vibrionivorans]TGD49291.1 nucleotide sugar dehydrogenase [Halobacteriovorax sp. Y22]